MPHRNNFTLIDQTGRRYEAYELTSPIDTSNLSGRSSVGGLSSYRLADGRRLNKIDEATFLLVATGAELKRTSA